MMRKGENTNYRLVPFLPGAEQKMPKKSKKIKKTKKHHYGVICSQNSLEWPRKRENKNYCFITFLPNALQKILKKQQKNKKNNVMA